MLFNNYKKWSLFCVLAGSLGFSLSMNPEHYNNIVRYEKDAFHSIAFASSAEKEQKVSGTSREVLVGTSKGSFKAKVTSIEGSTIVKFEKLGETEGQSCDLCGKTFSLESDFKDIAALNSELMTIANSDQKEEKAEDEKKVVAQKKGEATEVDIEEWAAKCEKIKGDSSKLSCHKNRIIELSKYLKNHADNATYINQYFTDYLKSEILAGFTNPTIKTSPFASNGFNFASDFDDEDSSSLQQSNDLTEEIIRGLQAKNGKQTIEVLVKMRAASFTAQLRHSQNLMIQGINESNPAKFNAGMQGMQPDAQRSILQQSTQSMLDSVSSMSASSSEKSYFAQYISNNMFSPVDNVLNQLKTHILNSQQTTGTNGQVQSNWTTFTIPSLGEQYVVQTSPGVVPDTTLSAMIRNGSQSRGADIQALVQWGTGQGAIANNNGLVPLPAPLNSQQQIPQMGLGGRTARQ